jgi:hypothetical protein
VAREFPVVLLLTVAEERAGNMPLVPSASAGGAAAAASVLFSCGAAGTDAGTAIGSAARLGLSPSREAGTGDIATCFGGGGCDAIGMTDESICGCDPIEPRMKKACCRRSKSALLSTPSAVLRSKVSAKYGSASNIAAVGRIR